MKLVEVARPEDRGAILQVLTATGLPTEQALLSTSRPPSSLPAFVRQARF